MEIAGFILGPAQEQDFRCSPAACTNRIVAGRRPVESYSDNLSCGARACLYKRELRCGAARAL